MCTVTYIPFVEGFHLTSNRDENPERGKPEWPAAYHHSAHRLFYPRDPKGKGTWIAADERGNVICLLNGAIEPHHQAPSYRKSRGLVVIDVFSFQSIETFYNNYDLHDIEPFTLVVIWEKKLFEFKWNGRIKTLDFLPEKECRIWSSVTLYKQEIIKKKEKLFRDWYSKTDGIDPQSILSFHLTSDPQDPANSIKMNRENVQTMCVTLISVMNNELTMSHYDLMEDQTRTSKFAIDSLYSG
jgi:hypothetical protein